MKKEILFEAIGNVDDALLARLSPPENAMEIPGKNAFRAQEENTSAPRQNKKKFRLFPEFSAPHARRYALAFCGVCLVFAAALFLPKFFNKAGNRTFLPLSDASHGVKVSIMENPPETMVFSSGDLLWLTEEELFTHFDTDIFEGTITDIQNIVLDFNGDKNYKALASIQVEKVFRGNCQTGDTVHVLLPCMIDVEGFWVSGTDVVSKMRVGTHGIFMPMIYDASSYEERNGARLLLTDLAPYGLADGERYCFLETPDGLVFARFAYESIAEISTLEEVANYIEKMLEKVSE